MQAAQSMLAQANQNSSEVLSEQGAGIREQGTVLMQAAQSILAPTNQNSSAVLSVFWWVEKTFGDCYNYKNVRW